MRIEGRAFGRYLCGRCRRAGTPVCRRQQDKAFHLLGKPCGITTRARASKRPRHETDALHSAKITNVIHRRAHIVRITPGGRRRLKAAHQGIRALEAELLAPLPEADRRTLRESLARLLAG